LTRECRYCGFVAAFIGRKGMPGSRTALGG
jgi:hypothetical protein